MEKEVGKVTHYFDKLQVAVIKLSNPLKVGDSIRIEAKDGDFTQTVSAMEVDHEPIQAGKKDEEVGLKVQQPVKEGNVVFLRV